MASVLYDLRMICWLFVWRKSEVVRSGVGVVENLEPGAIPAEGKSYLFSPVRGKLCIWKTKQVILKAVSSIWIVEGMNRFFLRLCGLL